MRRIAQDDGFSLMPSKNCQRMTEHLQSPILDYKRQGQALIGNPASWSFFAETSHSQVDNS